MAALSGNDRTFRDVVMEIVEEVVTTRTQGRQVNEDRLAGVNHLLPVKLEALKLDSFLAGIHHPDHERHAGLDFDFFRIKTVLIEADFNDNRRGLICFNRLDIKI